MKHSLFYFFLIINWGGNIDERSCQYIYLRQELVNNHLKINFFYKKHLAITSCMFTTTHIRYHPDQIGA